MRSALLLAGLLAVLAGGVSSQSGEATAERADFAPDYLGIETRLLEGDLVSFLVAMRGARSADDIETYAECAAGQYALIRGYGFARHVRTSLDETAGVWRADAVYTISEARPDGLKTLDAALVVEDCAARGIPTI